MPFVFAPSVRVNVSHRPPLAQKPTLPTITEASSSQAVSTDSYKPSSSAIRVPKPNANATTGEAKPNPGTQLTLQALFETFRHSNPVKIKMLIQSGISPNLRNRDHYYRTPLMTAASAGSLPNVKMLLQLHAKPDLQDDIGNTALHLAIREGHEDIAVELLAYNANPSLGNAFSQTPLMYAAERNLIALIPLLRKKGAFVDQTNCYGTTALMGAAACGNIEAAKQLLAAHPTSSEKANPNLSNQFGTTALMMAAREGHFKMVQLLVRHGALLHPINKNEQNALTLARQNGHHEIADWLEKKAHKFDYSVKKQPSLNHSQVLVTLEPKVVRKPERIIGFKIDSGFSCSPSNEGV